MNSQNYVTLFFFFLEYSPEALQFYLMSLTPVTRNFASVTRRVFCNRIVFSGSTSSRFALSKCFRVRGAKTRKSSHLPNSVKNLGIAEKWGLKCTSTQELMLNNVLCTEQCTIQRCSIKALLSFFNELQPKVESDHMIFLLPGILLNLMGVL